MEFISLDDLLTMVDGYATGNLKQPRPIIIWVDNMERELARMDPHGDIVGFAGYLASLYPTASATYVPGSPLTGYKYSLTENGVIRISDELFQSLTIDENVIKLDKNGKPVTRLYIHSPFSAQFGENGLTSLEYGQILHDRLGISVILMYPLEWKERLNADMSEYDHFLCRSDKENQLKQWFEDAKAHYQSGLQVVDNFYLDFLKQCPEYATVDFESEKPQGVTYTSYQKWEATSHRLFSTLYAIIFGMWTKETQENALILHNLFTDGNLNITALDERLNKIKDEDWSKRIEDCCDIKSIEPDYEWLSRIGIVICHLCGLGRRENIPTEVCIALWNYHKQKTDNANGYNIWTAEVTELGYATAKEQKQLEERFNKLCGKDLYIKSPDVLRLEHQVKRSIKRLNLHYESIGKERPVGPNEEKYTKLKWATNNNKE